MGGMTSMLRNAAAAGQAGSCYTSGGISWMHSPQMKASKLM
jgi:hypothetical protein